MFFRTGAIIGLVLAIIALLIAIPIILCFCFGCMCFKPKEPKIIGDYTNKYSLVVRKLKLTERMTYNFVQGVTPSATLRKQNRREGGAASSTPELRVESSESRKESLVVVPESRRESNNTPSAPGFSAYPLDDDPRAFYHNLGFEPPPPYVIGVDDNLTGMDMGYGEDAWADGEESAATSRFSSARPSAISVNEHGHGEKSRRKLRMSQILTFLTNIVKCFILFTVGPSLIKGRIT